MNEDFIKRIMREHTNCQSCPSPQDVSDFFTSILGIFYVDFSEEESLTTEQMVIDALKVGEDTLASLLRRSPMNLMRDPDKIAKLFFDQLPDIYDALNLDIEAIFQGDPASTSKREIVRCYPGFYAIAAYRVANALQRLDVDDLPRIITEHAHRLTGIDIHPAASIGHSFCIDHGTGIVIGATADIHPHVKIYQGVTLGALSVNKSDAGKKRHPTIKEHCVIYAGATILGGETIIGAHSIIGGNVWITRSVPSKSKIYYQAKMNVGSGDQTDTIVFKDFSR